MNIALPHPELDRLFCKEKVKEGAHFPQALILL
jgi:hypothetical protein